MIESEVESNKESVRFRLYDAIRNYKKNPSAAMSSFACGGTLPLGVNIPAVLINGVAGRLGYPLCWQQAKCIIEGATLAPFGKGTETIVDSDVRKTWQVDACDITIADSWLNASLPKLVEVACEKLGCDMATHKISANLYKLLLYEEGGHFKRHKDTEKEVGMFGTLLVQLPSQHTGGQLSVSHVNKTQKFNFERDSADSAYYAAFYADCEHVLEPVTSGYRLMLAFNLVQQPSSTAIRMPTSSMCQQQTTDEALVAATRQWCEDPTSVPHSQFAMRLDHEYTPTNLSFSQLKGHDKKLVQLLQSAEDPVTGQPLFSVYIALLEKYVCGQGEDEYFGRYCSGGATMCDEDKSVTISTKSWIGPEGCIDLGNLSVSVYDDMIDADSPDEYGGDDVEDALFPEDPDREEYEGYQGNYPGTLEYWYQAAVVVFWPRKMDFHRKIEAGFESALVQVENEYAVKSPDFSGHMETLLHVLASSSSSGKCFDNLSRLLAIANCSEQV